MFLFTCLKFISLLTVQGLTFHAQITESSNVSLSVSAPTLLGFLLCRMGVISSILYLYLLLTLVHRRGDCGKHEPFSPPLPPPPNCSQRMIALTVTILE